MYKTLTSTTSTVNCKNDITPVSLGSEKDSLLQKGNTNDQALVFVDPSVDDYQTLIAGLVSGTKAILLNAQQDGIRQISETLESYSHLQAIHIVAHGSPGCIYLGNSVLNKDTLWHYQGDLQSWRTALAENADLLLYGCRVADTSNQDSFLEALAALTQANVAASTSITGNAQQGGNWQLEAQIGHVTSSLALTAVTQQTYAGTLVTLNVDTTEDENDGSADTGAGLSLRDAIITANNDPDNDYTIELTGGQTYNLSFSDTQDSENLPDDEVADLDIIGGNVTIRGIGNNKAIIDASNIGGGGERRDRVFQVLENGNLTLENTQVTGGEAPVNLSGAADDGGGIYVGGNSELTLNNSTVSGNSASYGGGIGNAGSVTVTQSNISGNVSEQGGGIFNTIEPTTGNVGNLFLTNSTVSSNSAAYGGGISNTGSVTLTQSNISGNVSNRGGGIFNTIGVSGNVGNFFLTNSTVSGNSASDGGGIGNTGSVTVTQSNISGNVSNQGGGIFNTIEPTTGNVGNLSLTNSTVSSNYASNGGGLSNAGSATLTNSTISGNSTTVGGGIYNANYSSTDSNAVGSATLTNSTVASNSADYGSGLANAGSFTLTNSIVANNASSNEVLTNGNTNASGSNIVGDNSFTDANVTNQNPQLGPLRNNGGATPTHQPLDGSPAIDAGDNNEVVADRQDLDGDSDNTEPIPYDQRGDGFSRISNGRVDIGAVEVQQDEGMDDEIIGSDTDDILEGSEANDEVAAGNGNDVVITFSGNDILRGDTGNDIMNGGQGDDTLEGGDGNDILFGGQQVDIISGGNGDDFLSGDLQEDTLTGGNGSDRFLLRNVSGADIITDFEDGVDALVLPTSDFPVQPNGLTFENLNITQTEGSTVISVDGNPIAGLAGVDASNITEEDFQNVSSF